MKIVFGGAFNPITIAHIKVYEYIMKKMEADQFLFLPVSSAYTKSELASNYHRVNMLELVACKYDNLGICKLEIDDTDYLGTYQSLIRLSDKYNCDISFVIGADNLLYMDKWINIEGILREFKIIVLGRNGVDIRKTISLNPTLSKHLDSFIIFDDFNIEVSSTSFRKTMDRSQVDPDVYEYIQKNELYRGDYNV
ncbi:MAG: nicotinate (nicotinamide) nucleotide adenylyltransferase [Bacilli bacterium]|nr:nicotinate (nicotinamide) nucleotide adenylyltransferase [Bacilli bacterium]